MWGQDACPGGQSDPAYRDVGSSEQPELSEKAGQSAHSAFDTSSRQAPTMAWWHEVTRDGRDAIEQGWLTLHHLFRPLHPPA